MPVGRSLHIGLNRVDPAQYDGWDGALRGCINDANDMQALAKQLGYQTTQLLDQEATAANVTAAISAAAEALTPGDVFLLTYSGHGGQVPDTSGDESMADPGEFGERDDEYDETWVLFDRMLIDDELYELYRKFAPGTRVVVLSDSCHSGTVTRGETEGPGGDVVSRRIPLSVEDATYRAHQAMYDGIQRSMPPSQGTDSIGANVQLISGCMDNQVSQDGRRNGLFTTNFLKVWDAGNYAGSVRKLRSTIVRHMPSDQTPNFYVIGNRNRTLERANALRI